MVLSFFIYINNLRLNVTLLQTLEEEQSEEKVKIISSFLEINGTFQYFLSNIY